MNKVTSSIKKKLKEHALVVERMPAVLITISIPGVVTVEGLDKYGLSWEYIYFAIKDKQLTIIFSVDRMNELGELLLKRELEEPGYYDKLINEWKKVDSKFAEFCKELDSTDLTKLSLEELKKLYLKFVELVAEVWTIPLTANNISHYAENVFMPKITKQYGKNALDDFITLSLPLELSFIKQEERDLLKITRTISNDQELKEKTLNTNTKELLEYIKQKHPQIFNQLTEHSNNYHWLTNTYRDAVWLDEEYFLDQIQKLLRSDPKAKLEELERKKSEQIKKRNSISTKFSEEVLVFAGLVSKAAILQDLRKKNNLLGNYHILRFVRELANRLDYSYDELCQTTSIEMKRILNDENIPDLNSRNKYCVEVIERGSDIAVGGDTAEEWYNIIDNVDKVKEEVKEFPGVVASLGKYKGAVRVVLDVSKVEVFNEGDVLVASMTRPEYTPLMKKAGAIITNEGGITCHAAIVSRELNIPCIIGTKIATKVLKDGDLVEIDAHKGIVKVIK